MENPRIRATGIMVLLAILSTLAHVASGLQVTPGSSCAALCLDAGADPFDPSASSTNATDIVCRDDAYASEEQGIKFKQCLECMQKSQKQNGTETDVGWFVYNMRHALGTCLYGFGDKEKVIDSPCVIKWACGPLEDAITGGLKEGDPSWDYCEADNSALATKYMDSCVSCLENSDSEVYLSHFLTSLRSGCQQQPKPGRLLGLSGSPFSGSLLEITDAPSSLKEKDAGASSATITTGTMVGIGVGAGLFAIGGVALVWVYCRKKRAASSRERNGGAFEKNCDDPESRSSSRSMIRNSHQHHLQQLQHKQSYHIGGSASDHFRHQHSGSAASNYSSDGRYGAFYDPKAEEDGASTRSGIGGGAGGPLGRMYSSGSNNRAGSNTTRQQQQQQQQNALPQYNPAAHTSYSSHSRESSQSRGTASQQQQQQSQPQQQQQQQQQQKQQQGNAASESYMLQRFRRAPEVPSGLSNVTNMSPVASADISTVPLAITTTPAPAAAATTTPLPASAHFPNGVVPPPPPPPAKVPSITVPSVPRIRVPKKYTPPSLSSAAPPSATTGGHDADLWYQRNMGGGSDSR